MEFKVTEKNMSNIQSWIKVPWCWVHNEWRQEMYLYKLGGEGHTPLIQPLRGWRVEDSMNHEMIRVRREGSRTGDIASDVEGARENWFTNMVHDHDRGQGP